jgi:inhibitor of KinA
MEHNFRVHYAGDTALIVEFGDRIAAPLNAMVLGLSDLIEAEGISGVIETVPTFRSLMIQYDPDVITAQELVDRLDRLTPAQTQGASSRRFWELPVCYEHDCAMDLAEVATRLGLSCDDVVAQHTAIPYDVFMLGFLPGQPYLGELPQGLRLPRRTSPRTRIPAGSIGIATSLTCVYPAETPCGWHIIGRTPVPMWNLQSQGKPLFAPGDRVRLRAIGLDEFQDLAERVAADAFRLVPLESETSCQPH